MTATRSLTEIEKDLANIDHALSTVSEIRSSLKQFKTLVQAEQKGPSFVQSFGDKLKYIRRDLGLLSADSEALKGALEHAQIAAMENKFDWELIKSEADKEAEEEEMRFQEEKAGTGKAKEVGSIVKSSADHLYKELASIVLERKPTTAETEDKFFTKHINEWMNTNKVNYMDFSIGFLKEEQTTLTGSKCRVKIYIRRALAAELDMEYQSSSDTLLIHHYDIRSTKEEKNFLQESQYHLFQKLNLLATNALEEMLMFYAKESLFNVLNWFYSYSDLFSRPCQRCQKLLHFDSPQYKYLPPMVRTWTKKQPAYQQGMGNSQNSTGVAYHMRCFIEYKSNHSVE